MRLWKCSLKPRVNDSDAFAIRRRTMDQYTTVALGDWPRGLKVKKDEHPKRRPYLQDVGLVQARSGRADYVGVKIARFES